MSWRTTIFGIASIITAIAGSVTAVVDGNPATNPDWGVVIAAIAGGIGLINARDHKVSSEQAGAGK
jgi:hypothetical protein